MIITRAAVADDAAMMSLILSEILRGWNSDRPSDPEHVRKTYIEHPNKIACTVALNQDGQVIGFQSLQLAKAGNPYEVTPGWGIIGSYVKLGTARQGIGRLMFDRSHAAAEAAGIQVIDATIGSENALGLAYYEAMGFRTYKETAGSISKRFDLAPG